MPKKQQRTRINNLFSNLGESITPQEQADSAGLPGWTWECDLDGKYVHCSPEVMTCLGIRSASFIGQPLTTYAIPSEYSLPLRQVLLADTFPVTVVVYHQSAEGAFIPIQMQIQRRYTAAGAPDGYAGFSEVLSESPVVEEADSVMHPLPLAGEPSTPIYPSTATTTAQIRGVAISDGQVLPAIDFWTEAGRESKNHNTLVAHAPGKNQPAAIAVPFVLQDQAGGIVELVDETRRRSWTEDERLLVQDVANQLAQALENARLYATVQQELRQRVKAQQEITRRNQDLATINQIGQQLSRLTGAEEIFALAYEMIGQVLDNNNLVIAAYDARQKTLSFPVAAQSGQKIQLPSRPLGRSVADHIIRTQETLLISRGMTRALQARDIDLPEPLPVSLLGVPMRSGDRPLGAVILRDFEKEGVYTQVEAEILSTISSQIANALENANLFQDVRNALQTIENRERYQSGVAKAVATLAQFGSRSIVEVLELLGTADECEVAFFAQPEAGDLPVQWELIADWYASLSSPTLRAAVIPIFTRWVNELRENGWLSIQVADCPVDEQAYLTGEGFKSVLLLSVPGKKYTPGFLAFAEREKERAWLTEEINALRAGADGLANTFVREDLVQQIQDTLNETEGLYNISHRLALANTFDEMIEALILGFRIPTIKRAKLVLFERDAADAIVGMDVAGSWPTVQPASGEVVAYIDPAYRKFFAIQTPLFLDSIQQAEVPLSIQAELRSRAVQTLAVLPLWTSKRQLGVLVLEGDEAYNFTNREVRSLPPLVDQMATSVENRQLFEQTEVALSETELLYKISSGIAQAANLDDLARMVATTVMPRHAERMSLMTVNSTAEGEPLDIEVSGFYDGQGEFQRLGVKVPIGNLPIIRLMANEPLIISNTAEDSMDSVSRRTLLQFNIVSGCLIPLRSSGRLIGLLTATSRRPADYSMEDIRIMTVTGNGVAVALERQRLLREAQRRALELQTAAEIARDTTSTLSLDTLLSSIVNLLLERFDFYFAAVFLLDETGNYAMIREATGDAGRELKDNDYHLAVGSRSVVGSVTSSGSPLVLNDVSKSPLFLTHPLLPDTRSEMALPLRGAGKVIGALDLQSNRVNSFSQDEIAVFQILADQLAIAIENARAYQLSQEAFENIREMDRLKSQFLANMSHELRTPLNSIIGFSRVILKGIDGPINDTQRQDLSAIYNSGQHLLALINDVLDLSKIEAGKMELAFSEVNVGDIIVSAMSTAVGLTKDKPIQLRHVIPPNLPPVQADSTRVRQVLINFISNAAKFTEEGSITVEALLSTSPAGNPEIMVTVTDTGPGIAEKDQVKLFLAFSQVDDSPTRKTGGTGLGLSISRSLIEMHGGRIGLLKSVVGEGSTFFFTLPLPKPEPEPESVEEGTNVILAIDDDPQVISLYERFLQPQGYQVVPLTDPTKAVERAREVKPFAITLDIMMPERDGWQVIHDLKSDIETHGIPVIICSIVEDEEKGFSLGAADYLVKPFLQEDLTNAIIRLNADGNIHRVLVIDDDPDDLRLVQKMIEDGGDFQALLAESGERGLEMLENMRPDAIILDLFMPGLNGFAVLEKLRSDPKLGSIPVIILTGADLTADQHKQLAEFGKRTLTKGMLRERELITSLEESLRKIKSQRRE